MTGTDSAPVAMAAPLPVEIPKEIPVEIPGEIPEHDRDPYVADVIEGLRRWAREGGDPSPNATQTECLARQNLWRKRNGETVRILDVHGRMRSDVLNDVGRAFRVGGYSGEAGDKSKTVRDRIRRTAK